MQKYIKPASVSGLSPEHDVVSVTCVCVCVQVQLQLLTATVKLFLKRPTEAAQKMISLVLSCATNETDNPDLRDRAYIYWRLLSTDPEVTRGRGGGTVDAGGSGQLPT